MVAAGQSSCAPISSLFFSHLLSCGQPVLKLVNVLSPVDLSLHGCTVALGVIVVLIVEHFQSHLSEVVSILATGLGVDIAPSILTFSNRVDPVDQRG